MSEQAGGKAQIDFLCVEDGCGGVVKFDLMSLAQEDFQALCPKCHKPYQFDAELRAKRLRFGLVFQNFNLFPHFSVLRNITEAQVRVLGRSQSEAEKNAFELLEKMDLQSKAHAYPYQLSGGQQQRVSIAPA